MVVIDRPSDRQRKSRREKKDGIYMCLELRQEENEKEKGKEKKAVPILPPSRE